MDQDKTSILVIYTGGTIGMKEDPMVGSLIPIDFDYLLDYVPELNQFDYQIETIMFEEPLDSSDIDISTWVKLAVFIEKQYNSYDGFVVLHGTDTMAYTASALSFLLENLGKPIVVTGSQLPMGKLRTDGRENLITAIEIAASFKEGKSRLQEVAVFFDEKLYRGSRTHKYNTENFDAIESANFPALADVGVHVFYNNDLMLPPKGDLIVHRDMEERVAVMKIFPGMNESYVKSILNINGLQGLVIESFGSGNVPTKPWFFDCLKNAIERGVKIVNVTDCNKGFVEQGRYATSSGLSDAGVIGASDMTLEAALTKMMYLLAYKEVEFDYYFVRSLRGELTWYSKLV